MKYTDALPIAEKLVDLLIPGCSRIEIAGSLRRKKDDVGDIEIIAIPDMRPVRPTFGMAHVFATTLDAVLYGLAMDGDESGIMLHALKGGGKYKQYWVSQDHGYHLLDIKLDLFLVTPPAQWGSIFMIRTGPADFSKWMVTPRSHGGALPDGYDHQKGSAVRTSDGQIIPMPEEIDYFNFCGLPYIEPENRQPGWGFFNKAKPQVPAAIYE
jgi:DNA polymerase/3'-5' exonuclease PolX